jgi:hypothetical protein
MCASCHLVSVLSSAESAIEYRIEAHSSPAEPLGAVSFKPRRRVGVVPEAMLVEVPDRANAKLVTIELVTGKVPAPVPKRGAFASRNACSDLSSLRENSEDWTQ